MLESVQNSAEIRSLNRKKIIEYLRWCDSATKKVISDELNLSFATVSNLCNQLIEEGILEIESSQSSNGGRIPGLLSINPVSKFALCLNIIRRTILECALINLKGNVVALKRCEIPEGTGFDKLVKIYYDISCKVLKENRVSHANILGVGVAAPGIFYKDNQCIVNSFNPVLENKPLKAEIERIFMLPAYIENESNLLVLATSLFERNKHENRDIIYLYIAEGLGTGIICNGKLLTGCHGLGGEISHMPIGERKYKCYCGKTSCIESELLTTGFVRKYCEAQGIEPDYSPEGWKRFLQDVAAGNQAAESVIKENGRLIGRLISILVDIFDPEAFYIGGITEILFDRLYPHIRKEVKDRLVVAGMSDINIYNSVDYDGLLLKGCGELVFMSWRS